MGFYILGIIYIIIIIVLLILFNKKLDELDNMYARLLNHSINKRRFLKEENKRLLLKLRTQGKEHEILKNKIRKNDKKRPFINYK